ncbi:MAG: hypothetical protein QOJ80_2792 [Mycobacterium sp.]|jgi:hypothetical protein|nr:hypothetical protein [Mycobacterium sp.]
MTAVTDPSVTLDTTSTERHEIPTAPVSPAAAGDDETAPVVARTGDRMHQQAARLSLVRRTRTTAVVIDVLICAAACVLSFSSLRDLAARTVWSGNLGWLFPVIVDGAQVLASMALVAFSAYPEQRSARRYFWVLLAIGVAVSVSGNAVHALMPNPDLLARPFSPWFAAAIGCVPSLAVVSTTHALSILWRFVPYERPDKQAELKDNALALAAKRLDRWDAVAAAIHERGLMMSQPTAKIADVLRTLHDTQPSLPLRQIGQQVGLRHDAVARIRDAAKVVLDQADGA